MFLSETSVAWESTRHCFQMVGSRLIARDEQVSAAPMSSKLGIYVTICKCPNRYSRKMPVVKSIDEESRLARCHMPGLRVWLDCHNCEGRWLLWSCHVCLLLLICIVSSSVLRIVKSVHVTFCATRWQHASLWGEYALNKSCLSLLLLCL